ncbi:NUDIX hydrolase [Niabella beijingensis]|uniref:NUDIX hydrolase n=1 Tax=Niabella beijingensis TaxID=2872700 RepID=UPI001CBAB35D|nr:NUDIX hydrolase [Niabella beijingensis]MBZ4189308.1 NUDIX hydrolase [Niabella beijingensis]
MAAKYSNQSRYTVAVDCIVFGYDGNHLKILLVKRAFAPLKGKWSLMGGFISKNESADEAASRILVSLTGLTDVYQEQFYTFTDPDRDTQERTVSIAYFSLIDIKKYRESLSDAYQAEWFSIKDFPDLIFDHKEMVKMAKKRLQYKATSHAILFELLPDKFTLPLLQSLFEDVYETSFDKGNFSRKMLSTGLLLKQRDKDKTGSKKGAYFYKLDRKNYQQHLHKILKLVPNPNNVL